MLKLLGNLTSAVVKTTVGLPVSIVADTLTLGGVLTDKKGEKMYSGDMIDSIGKSIERIAKDE